MNFRVTSFASSNQALRFASQYSSNILNYQRQISSGVKIHRPSDDPVSFRQISTLSVRFQELKSEVFTITDSETKINASVSQLQDSHDLIVRARTLAQQGVQATSQSERNALAAEMEGLFVSLKDITQTKTAGSYLYAGAKTDQVPYEFNEPNSTGGTLNVEYLGSPNNSRAYIGDAISVDTFYAGEKIFSNSDRQPTLMIGDTGAKVGQTGTDNMVGRTMLQVRHSTTTYSGTSGISPGSSSAEKDTLIGQTGTHHIQITDTSGTGDSGTISLNNGTSFNWTKADTNLQITGNNGGKMFVDMSAIAPGFDGVVDFASSGTLSVDGGLSQTAIDFSASQIVVDSTTETQVHIDSSEIHMAGDEIMEFPGTSDLFQVFYELTQDLRNSRGLGNKEQAESLDRRLGELNQLGDHVLGVMGQQSASLQTLDELDFRIKDLQLEVETQLSDLQSTDIPNAILRMQNDQSLLEYTYAVTARIASTSLIDFLR